MWVREVTLLFHDRSEKKTRQNFNMQNVRLSIETTGNVDDVFYNETFFSFNSIVHKNQYARSKLNVLTSMILHRNLFFQEHFKNLISILDYERNCTGIGNSRFSCGSGSAWRKTINPYDLQGALTSSRHFSYEKKNTLKKKEFFQVLSIHYVEHMVPSWNLRHIIYSSWYLFRNSLILLSCRQQTAIYSKLFRAAGFPFLCRFQGRRKI